MNNVNIYDSKIYPSGLIFGGERGAVLGCIYGGMLLFDILIRLHICGEYSVGRRICGGCLYLVILGMLSGLHILGERRVTYGGVLTGFHSI